MTSSIQAILYNVGKTIKCPHTGVIFQSAKVIIVDIHKGMLFEAFK